MGGSWVGTDESSFTPAFGESGSIGDVIVRLACGRWQGLVRDVRFRRPSSRWTLRSTRPGADTVTPADAFLTSIRRLVDPQLIGPSSWIRTGCAGIVAHSSPEPDEPYLSLAPDTGLADQAALNRAFEGGWIAPLGPEVDRSDIRSVPGVERPPIPDCGLTRLAISELLSEHIHTSASVTTSLTPGREDRDWRLRWEQLLRRLPGITKPRSGDAAAMTYIPPPRISSSSWSPHTTSRMLWKQIGL